MSSGMENRMVIVRKLVLIKLIQTVASLKFSCMKDEQLRCNSVCDFDMDIEVVWPS